MLRIAMLPVLALCLAAGPAAPAPRIVMGPYVNRVGPSRATILWVSEPAAPAALVRLKGGGRELLATSVSRSALRMAVFEDLTPATRYEYRIGGGEAAATGSFVTAPPPGASDPIRFVIYGDARTYPDRHRSVTEAIAREDPAFVVCSGDLVTNGQVWEQWGPQFFGPAAPYLTRSVLWPVRGNHEGDAVIYRELFDLPGNELYYSFNYGNAHFIVLDCYSERAKMLKWLKRDLAKNRAEWTFVVLHEPMFNVGGHASAWGREDFLPVLEEQGVDFVVAGHSHIYERFLPIGPPGRKPLIHVVSGGGGAPAYTVETSPALAGGVGSPDLHYCLFEIDGNRCTMTVKRPDGSVLDSLSLVKVGDAYQDSVMAEALETKKAAALTSLFVDLTADFPSLPQPGQTAQATLGNKALALVERVAISGASDEAGWQVVPRQGAPEDGAFPFEVIAPDNVTVGIEGFRPPLRVSLRMTVAGKAFEADDLALRPTAATVRRAIPEPEPVDLPRARRKVTVDGDLAEWVDVPPLPLPFQGRAASSVRLCWRPEGLYGAARVQDDDVSVDPKAPWRADTLELFIDGDFSRGIERTRHSAQYAFSPAPERGPGPGHCLVAYAGSPEAQAGVRCAWSGVDGGYALEFFVPADALGLAAMEAGRVLGFNFALSNDGAPVEQFYSDKNRDHGWRTPLTWGALRLAK